MGRSPSSDASLTRGPWSKDEDGILRSYIERNGVGKWKELPKLAGLKRCGKSCRLRWINYLQPGIKRGNFSEDEEKLIVNLHKDFGNRWSRIADQLEGRTDNEIKNYWNTTIKKKLIMKGINPVTHQQMANFNILQNFPNLLAAASNLNNFVLNPLNNNDAFHQIPPNVQLLQTLIHSIINGSDLIPNMEAMIQPQSLTALHNLNHSTLNGFGTNNSSADASYFSSPATNAMPCVQNNTNMIPSLAVSSSIAIENLNQSTFGYPVSGANVFDLSGSLMNHGRYNSNEFVMNNSGVDASTSTITDTTNIASYFSTPDTMFMPSQPNTSAMPSIQITSPQNISGNQAWDEENVTSTSSGSLEFNWEDLLRACSGTDM